MAIDENQPAGKLRRTETFQLARAHCRRFRRLEISVRNRCDTGKTPVLIMRGGKTGFHEACEGLLAQPSQPIAIFYLIEYLLILLGNLGRSDHYVLVLSNLGSSCFTRAVIVSRRPARPQSSCSPSAPAPAPVQARPISQSGRSPAREQSRAQCNQASAGNA